MKRMILLLIAMQCCMLSKSQAVIPLYTDSIPNSIPGPDEEVSEITPDHQLLIEKISHPTLTIFLPEKEKASGTAVIICPGGGYHNFAAGYEGSDVAKKFNETGIAAFVLKYRIPDDHTMMRKEIGPLQDAQRAIQIVRQRAKEWGLNASHIGILGFSAGGHLASTAGTHFMQAVIKNEKEINLRPDFMILVYPVISFTDSIGHMGSRENLIGKNPSQEKIWAYSNELQITGKTPPTFLVHAKDDDVVPVQNSLDFCSALKKNHVSAEIYLYEKGGHGFGLTNPTSPVKWLDLVLTWIQKNGW
ncbi:MAG: alpha/beta hydrolase [Bacteroidetes bacterium]|nr:MAG: alpha/beta hydrolase [Bacteroidota bacterium]